MGVTSAYRAGSSLPEKPRLGFSTKSDPLSCGQYPCMCLKAPGKSVRLRSKCIWCDSFTEVTPEGRTSTRTIDDQGRGRIVVERRDPENGAHGGNGPTGRRRQHGPLCQFLPSGQRPPQQPTAGTALSNRLCRRTVLMLHSIVSNPEPRTVELASPRLFPWSKQAFRGGWCERPTDLAQGAGTGSCF